MASYIVGSYRYKIEYQDGTIKNTDWEDLNHCVSIWCLDTIANAFNNNYSIKSWQMEFKGFDPLSLIN